MTEEIPPWTDSVGTNRIGADSLSCDVYLSEDSVGELAAMLSDADCAIVDELTLDTNKGTFKITAEGGNIRLEYVEDEDE